MIASGSRGSLMYSRPPRVEKVTPRIMRARGERIYARLRRKCTKSVPRLRGGPQGARRLGRVDVEGEGLLEVERDGVGIVVGVADREVLARFEPEVAAAQGDDDRAAHAGGPGDRAALEALAQVVEEQDADVFGGLDHAGVLVGAERERVGAHDPVAQQ